MTKLDFDIKELKESIEYGRSLLAGIDDEEGMDQDTMDICRVIKEQKYRLKRLLLKQKKQCEVKNVNT